MESGKLAAIDSPGSIRAHNKYFMSLLDTESGEPAAGCERNSDGSEAAVSVPGVLSSDRLAVQVKEIDMVRRLFLFLLIGVAAWAADDAWSKVKALKTGTDLRIYKKGSTQPILAQMDELTDDNLIVIVKKTQTAIAREDIDRIDARPAGGRVTAQTTTKETAPDSKSAAEQTAGRGQPDVPGTTTSSSVVVGSKPDFELVYRRALGAPKK
jgi:hypothetical protein